MASCCVANEPGKVESVSSTSGTVCLSIVNSTVDPLPFASWCDRASITKPLCFSLVPTVPLLHRFTLGDWPLLERGPMQCCSLQELVRRIWGIAIGQSWHGYEPRKNRGAQTQDSSSRDV